MFVCVIVVWAWSGVVEWHVVVRLAGPLLARFFLVVVLEISPWICPVPCRQARF